MRRYTKIKNLSEQRRLPRAGKIRLGYKTDKGRPVETPYFIVPDEVKRCYGDEPTMLDVLLPVEQEEVMFPQAYEMYGQSRGLFCTGDGETAMRFNDDTRTMVDRECPCEYLEQNKCKKRGHLMVMLPRVSVGQVYQIDTSSYNSIVDINSGIDYIRALIGRVAMVPMKLLREATETHYDRKDKDGEVKRVKQTHYTMKLVFDGDLDSINQLRSDSTRVLLSTSALALPQPVRENPEAADVAAIDDGDMVSESVNGIDYITLEQAEELQRLVAETSTDEARFLSVAEASDYTKIVSGIFPFLITHLEAKQAPSAIKPAEPSEYEKIRISITKECKTHNELNWCVSKIDQAEETKLINPTDALALRKLVEIKRPSA